MQTSVFGWYSQRVNMFMEYLRAGDRGTPVLLFPTSGGDHREYTDRGMVATLESKIDQGLVQLFCLDTNNRESWYNDRIPPRERVERAVLFEEYVIREMIPHLRQTCGTDRLILFGASFGGYQAINFALKHPDLVDKAVSLSGSFSIRGLLEGYYDETCYFNCPIDYIRNLYDSWYIDRYNTHTELIFVSGDQDNCLQGNVEMTDQLKARGIRHQFHVWQGGYPHDWPSWKMMIGHYI